MGTEAKTKANEGGPNAKSVRERDRALKRGPPRPVGRVRRLGTVADDPGRKKTPQVTTAG